MQITVGRDCYGLRQCLRQYYPKYYPNFQRAVAQNFSSSFTKIFLFKPKLIVLWQCMQSFVTSKNGKFRDMRSFLRQRGADFAPKRPFFRKNHQKRLCTASKMTSYFWIFHSLRSRNFAYTVTTLLASVWIKKILVNEDEKFWATARWKFG